MRPLRGRRFASLALTIAFVGVVGCASGDDLDGTTWRAVEIAGRPVLADVDATIGFSGGEVSGSSSCNSYTGTYDASSGGAYGGAPTLSITNVGGTEMACEGPVMDQEARFIEALLNVATYRLESGRLELYEDDTLVASFQRTDVG